MKEKFFEYYSWQLMAADWPAVRWASLSQTRAAPLQTCAAPLQTLAAPSFALVEWGCTLTDLDCGLMPRDARQAAANWLTVCRASPSQTLPVIAGAEVLQTAAQLAVRRALPMHRHHR